MGRAHTALARSRERKAEPYLLAVSARVLAAAAADGTISSNLGELVGDAVDTPVKVERIGAFPAAEALAAQGVAHPLRIDVIGGVPGVALGESATRWASMRDSFTRQLLRRPSDPSTRMMSSVLHLLATVRIHRCVAISLR